MADRDVFSKYSLDNILEEAKMYSGETEEKRIWSMEDIDALLAGEDYPSLKSDNREDSAFEEKETSLEKQTERNEIPETTTSVKEDVADKPTVTEKEPFNINVNDEPDSNEFSLDFSALEKDTVSLGDLLSAFENDEKPNINLKEAAIINSIKHRANVKSDIDDSVLPETPLVDGTVPNLGEIKSDDEDKDSKKFDKNVLGQISIQKTRVFNEIDAGAVHNDEIHHNIGNKVVHTAPVSNIIPKGKGLETDKYRERFLSKPQLQMEKTLDHEKLMSSMPPKTFEKYGVIVKKPKDGKTSEDGLMPVPTIVAAEDELKALSEQEMQLRTGELKSFAMQNTAEEEALLNQIKLEGFEAEDSPEVVDEYEAEMNLIGRRREKAKKFRLFPNLPSQDKADQDLQDDEADNIENEKTRFNILGDLQDDSFDEDDENVHENIEIEDEELKKPPRKKRKKKSPEADCDSEIRIAREYYSPKDYKAVCDIMRSEKRRAGFKAVVLSIIGIILAAADIFVSFSGNYNIFGGSVTAFISVNLGCLLVAAVIESKEIVTFFKGLVSKNIGRSAMIVLSLFAGILQSGAAFGFAANIGSGTHIYAPVAFLPLVLVAIGDVIKAKNDINNFDCLKKKSDDLYSVSKIDDDIKAFEIGRGLLLGEPDIRYSSKISFASKFVEMTKRREPANDLINTAAPAVFIAGLVVAAVTGFISKNVFFAISAFTGVVLLGIPVSSVLSSSDILRSSNKALLGDNSFVSGYAAVDDAVRANAVVIDASDLFLYGGCNIYGIKPLHSMRIDEAILYTAAVIIQSGGTLSDVFDRIILSKREILPSVESLAYEEKLGCSGWINNQRILVGNRELLSKHNVEVPSKESEEKYKNNGRQVIYLAVEGKTAALFVVGYKPNDGTEKYLNLLEKYGVSILVRTTDPNITESMIEQYFDLPRNFVKVINPVAGKLFKELYDEEKPTDVCRIMHDGKVDTLLRSFLSAFSIHDRLKISTVLQCIGIGIGILIEALLSFTSGLSQAGVLQMLIFQIVWTLIVIVIPKFKRI